ncbi:MAG: amidohydrolase family protein [Candidatus Aminicenantes bacterium]|nr:amidohydrolase family protein [Candidatus Aminicenantes bacterium]
MGQKINRRKFLKDSGRAVLGAGLGGYHLVFKGTAKGKQFDTVIKGGLIRDGRGNQEFLGDIGINGEWIEQIGKISASKGRSVIDAQGLTVCPGFIDAHDHSDIGLLVNPNAESHIRQGITTLVSGNCGSSPFPVPDVLYEKTKTELKNAYGIQLSWRDILEFFSEIQKKGTALNYSTFLGHGSLRGAVVGFNDRPPKQEELRQMQSLVKQNIKAGALGLSTGLEYAPGSYAQTSELVSLCQAVGECGGLYATHMRDEGDQLLEALDEAIIIARKAGIPLQISHFKCAYPRNWDKLDQAIGKIEQAQKQGMDLYCDRYPYTAGATGLSSFNFPLWAKQGTTEEFLNRLKDPDLESKFKQHLKQRENKVGSWDKVYISSVASQKNSCFEGKSVWEGMKMTGKGVFEFMRDLLIEEKDRVGMIIFMMNEENLKKVLSHPLVGVGCDSSVLAPYGKLGSGKPHPRGYGTFPRVLGKYVGEQGIVPMNEMIEKMTHIPAKRFGFKKRGSLEKGHYADLVLFDEKRIKDKATYENPHQYPEGIEFVLVNGDVVINRGDHTGHLPGKILRKEL